MSVFKQLTVVQALAAVAVVNLNAVRAPSQTFHSIFRLLATSSELEASDVAIGASLMHGK